MSIEILPAHYAVFSDAHSNLEALDAVLGDIDKRRIPKIFCLGDIIGYGANPKECLRLTIQRCQESTIRGNHDEAAFFKQAYKKYNSLNPTAVEAIEWTDKVIGIGKESEDLWKFIETLPYSIINNGAGFFHGSPVIGEYLEGYVFSAPLSQDEESVRKWRARTEFVFSNVSNIAFIGGTHIPVIFTQTRGRIEVISPVAEQEYRIGTGKSIINVGSVGQPRDGDRRACYVEINSRDGVIRNNSVIFRRVEYDVNAACQKILDAKGLDSTLGYRLLSGR